MRPQKILVIEDQAPVREAIVDVIRFASESYEVIEADTGVEGVLQAQRHLPDLVITDWDMPDISGIEVIKQLKAADETRDILIIMCTGKMTDPENLRMALEAGAADYICKPPDFVELTARLNSMLELSNTIRDLRTRKAEIREEKERSERLLLNILPKSVAEELKTRQKATTRMVEGVSVLFSDFVGFTQIAETITPEALINELNEHFIAFDLICEKHGVEKIKTIGDAYMCAGGVPDPVPESAIRTVKAALDMVRFVKLHNQRKREKNMPEWHIRIGIHTGDVIAGVVGKNKFAYDIWGDTVNTAARVESAGDIDMVNISASTFALLDGRFKCVPRGKVYAKDKGEIEMYFIEE